MDLSKLGFACFCYGNLTKNDESYLHLLQTTNNSINLGNINHRYALIKWLNKWGCRQFSVNYHELAQNELLAWYNQYSDQIFSQERNIWELREEDFPIIKNLFGSLSNRIASIQHRNNMEVSKRFGPIGAAKILFVIRPKCFISWDNPIIDAFNFGRTPDSYICYVQEVINIMHSLKTSCEENGFNLADLPEKLNRVNSSVPKLVDEYFWMTITKNWSLPETHTFNNWVSWTIDN